MKYDYDEFSCMLIDLCSNKLEYLEQAKIEEPVKVYQDLVKAFNALNPVLIHWAKESRIVLDQIEENETGIERPC